MNSTQDSTATQKSLFARHQDAGSFERLWHLFQFGHHPPQQAVHGGRDGRIR